MFLSCLLSDFRGHVKVYCTDPPPHLPPPSLSPSHARSVFANPPYLNHSTGANPPYFSATVDPISSLQEPALHSTKSLRNQLDALDAVNFAQADPTFTESAAYNETLRHRNKLVNYDTDAKRYQGLVPIDIAVPPPPRRIAKQVDPDWVQEVSSENKPKVGDIPLPEPQMPDSARMPHSDPARERRAPWSRDAAKFRAANLRSRYRAYCP